jgi:hypothetical protein
MSLRDPGPIVNDERNNTSEPMPSEVENMRCEGCGVNFHCGMHDTRRCWCATKFPPVIRGTAGGSCLCPRCLEKLVSAPQARS